MLLDPFRYAPRIAWPLAGAVGILAVASFALLAGTAKLRYERDTHRMVFNDNLGVLEQLRAKLGVAADSLHAIRGDNRGGSSASYLVVSIADRHLWYKRGDSILFEAPVATGSGRELIAGTSRWRFETPRGRLAVVAKETDPAWVPPDWHFIEQARRRGLGLVRLERGQSLTTPDGGSIYVVGTNVVKRSPDGTTRFLGTGSESREIITGGNVIIPPYGTNARRYKGVLGTHRLVLGDGYAIHGTDRPETIGQAVSHGCVRMHNRDIAQLYEMVEPGTAVYIY